MIEVLLVAVLTMAIATAVAVGISFYLYRWRTLLIDGSPYLVPEHWAKVLADQNEHLNKLALTIDRVSQHSNTALNECTLQISNMTDTFMTLRTVIDEREKEIKRLKRGYDRDVYGRFLMRFIHVDVAIAEYQKLKNDNQHDFQVLKRLSEDALDECGVERFEPQIGADYRALGDQVADHPKIQETTNTEDNFKVNEVIQSGYG